MINTEKRWGIKLKKEIFSDVNELWKIISKAGHLEKIHPYCKSNNTIKWSGKNSIDILIYLNGMRYVREFKSWNPKKGFSLVIGEENKEKSYVEWEISNANNKTSTYHWPSSESLGIERRVSKLALNERICLNFVRFASLKKESLFSAEF